ncbi:hypothetical protein PR048_001719 [Dryococelus australis]|uniref:Uncharacterized protein n=1 Tax=Dryococelus australis TaxID=614101 RepID=A0ABQ9II50_9NEOP|nr:hypothetical protein PR048_001719 [Dryococelus australis]
MVFRAVSNGLYISIIWLVTDESSASFGYDGVFNIHNSHVWKEFNPHATFICTHQKRFYINVWAGIVDNSLIGHYLLPRLLNGHHCYTFLADIMPELLEGVPLDTRLFMCVGS